jgi:hypothetical protein
LTFFRAQALNKDPNHPPAKLDGAAGLHKLQGFAINRKASHDLKTDRVTR